MADGESAMPSPLFKRRPKPGSTVKASASTSSLRSFALVDDDDGGDGNEQSSSKGTPSKANEDDQDDDIGNVAVVRNRGKKTPAGRVKQREALAGSTGTGPGRLKSRLSFGATDESEDTEEAFAVKRAASPASARRLLRPNAVQLPQNLDQATISPAPARSMYSKQHLDELKAGQLSNRPAAATNQSGGYDELTRSKFGSEIQDDSETIPTSAAIAEAKQKRERMRALGDASGVADSGFISLDVGFANKGGESRLVREDDEIGDGDDDMADFTGAQEKVPLGKKANKEAAQRLKAGMIDMIDDVEDEPEDEEQREWELAQIKRGEQRVAAERVPTKKTYRPAPIPQTTTLPTLTSVSGRLQSALSSLESAHSMDAATLGHFAHERAELDAQEQELRKEVERVEHKNRWFSDFKTFIEEVAAFLDEKFPQLEKVEHDNLSIQKERYDIVAKRRFEDDSDDVALFTGVPVPSSFEREATSVEANGETDELGRSTSRGDLAPKSGSRIARRQARQRRIARRRNREAPADDLGTHTDDELDTGDSDDLADALRSLRESLARLFEDVKADDFRDPNLGIRAKFAEWRRLYGEEYRNAFGGLALVGVWEFWARVEMALWNPFEIEQLAKTPSGLDSYQWHANLTAFGHAGRLGSADGDDDDEQDEQDEQDESEEIVNLLVTSVVIPRLTKLAKATYDPMSGKQTSRAIGLVDEVSYCVERTSPRFESLVQAFLTRVQEAITRSQSLVLPHLAQLAQPANAFDPSTFQARQNFMQRQVKLLENASKWRRYGRSVRLSALTDELAGAGLMFDELVQRELVAKVIVPLVEASWSSGGQEIASRVLDLLPKDAPDALKRRLQGQQ